MQPNLKRKGRTWNWTQYHNWLGRQGWKVDQVPLIQKDTKVFTMGSCFAQNVGRFLRGKGVDSISFPETTHYNLMSTWQDLQHLLVKPQYSKEDMWVTDEKKWAHPFRKPTYRADTYEKLKEWSDRVDKEALEALLKSDLIVITLGGTESWRHPKTKKTYLTLPFPDVFNSQMPEIAEFHNLTFNEHLDCLENIYSLLRKKVPKANILFTVSPNRMTFTVSDKDVVLATCQGKSTLRASVGELLDLHKNAHLYYFHSYEIIEYAKFPVDLLEDEMLHVNAFAVTVVMSEFMKTFGSSDLHDQAHYDLTQDLLKQRASQYHVPTVPMGERLKMGLIKSLRQANLEKPALKIYRVFRPE